MISDEFRHEVGCYMQSQADRLLAHQAGIASASYNTRSGSLARALASRAEVKETTVSIPYPVHIRFLDLKKTRTGRRKRPVSGPHPLSRPEEDTHRQEEAQLHADIQQICVRLHEVGHLADADGYPSETDDPHHRRNH